MNVTINFGLWDFFLLVSLGLHPLLSASQHYNKSARNSFSKISVSKRRARKYCKKSGASRKTWKCENIAHWWKAKYARDESKRVLLKLISKSRSSLFPSATLQCSPISLLRQARELKRRFRISEWTLCSNDCGATASGKIDNGVNVI